MSQQISSGSRFAELMRSLGPGILAASAAVGGSHLVSSTQAGAIYGWALALFILLVNFLKYPFFRTGPAYTLAAGEDLVCGYKRLGRLYVWLLWALEAYGGITSVAACCAFSAAIICFAFPALPMPASCAAVMASCLAILLGGQYKALNTVSKFMVAALSFITVLAVVLLFCQNPAAASAGKDVSPWTMASLGFIVMLMGWMPCPLDLAAIQSLWVVCQQKEAGSTRRGIMADFNLGMVATALLAVVFLALGVLVMHAGGIAPAKSGAAFTRQLVDMYATAIGGWSRPFMLAMAFACIWGSTITVLDGYTRVVAVCQLHMWGEQSRSERPAYIFWLLLQTVLALLLVLAMRREMLVLLKFAMISAFCTTPVIALMNYRLMTGPYLKSEDRYGPAMRAWSLAGLVFLFGFLAVFLYWMAR